MERQRARYYEMQSSRELVDEIGFDLLSGGGGGSGSSGGGDSSVDSLGMGVVRKEVDLNHDERQYLLGVERGDVPRVQQCLQEATVGPCPLDSRPASGMGG